MQRLPEDFCHTAMDFALELARDSENFPKKVLSLLDKHFAYHRSIFFPCGSSIFPGGQPRRAGALSNYVTYGISYGLMYNYKDRLHREDVFRYSRLPAQYKGARVVYLQDLMPYETFLAGSLGSHLAAEELEHPAVLYFYENERVIGSLGLFRSKEKGPFREEERPCLEYLAQLIEANYQTYLRHSGEARFHDSFTLFYQDSKLGAVILNQDMTVLQANSAAKEISRIFWEQYRHNQGHFLRSNYQGDAQFREIQTMINEVSDRLGIQGGSSQTLTSLSLAGDITFYHSSFLSTNAAGLIQTWHLMLITCQTKQLPKNRNHPYNALTQQERRIVYYLSSGMKNEQIAEELHISIYTVRTHIANIYKKFEVNNKVDLLMRLQPILKEQQGEGY